MSARPLGGVLVVFALAVGGAGRSQASQDRVTCCEKRLLCCARSLACCRVRPPQQYPCCVKGYDCCNRYPSACCKPRVK
jgi:hypothetical protein